MKQLFKTTLFLASLGCLLFAFGCGSSDDDRSFGTEQSSRDNDQSTTSSTASVSLPSSSNTGSSTSSSSSPSSSSSSSSSSSNFSSSSVIRDFLWKPVSEKNGNVVVLVNPTNVRVVVSGDISETLTDFGPSNGRGTTARGSFTGCDYGDNVRVEFFTSSGRQISVAGGNTAVIVRDGCSRVEFKR